MRQILIIVALFIFISSSFAQKDENFKRNRSIGGNFSFSKLNGDDFSQNLFIFHRNFTFRPSNIKDGFYFKSKPYLGYQFHPKWYFCVGLDLIFGKYHATQFDFSTNISSELNIKDTQTGLGVFARYNFNPDNKFSLILEPSFFIRRAKLDVVNIDNIFPNYNLIKSFLDVALEPKVTYKIYPKWVLLASFVKILFIQQFGVTEGTTLESNNFSMDFGIQKFSFGIEFIF